MNTNASIILLDSPALPIVITITPARAEIGYLGMGISMNLIEHPHNPG
jgi:hypothetical protein